MSHIANYTKACLLSLCVLGFAACNSEKTSSETQSSLSEDSASSSQTVQKVFYSIPSPIEASMLLKKAGAQYSKELLNPISNESKYSSNFKKSVNMGIYAANLAYCNMFNQTQEALNYLTIVNKMGTTIGLTGIIEQVGILGRFQQNIGNKDSLMVILSDLFRESDQYLKENDQYNTAAIVLGGGWVEGLHIACHQAKKNRENGLRKLIAEQKLSLNSLIKLLPEAGEDKELAAFKTSLADLQKSFEKVSLDAGEMTVSTDTVTRSSVVSGSNIITISDDILKEITDKTIAIRTNLVK